MEECIKKIINQKFNINCNNETSLIVLAEDSFGQIELLMEIEQKLKIKIPEDDILSIETVKDLIEVIKRIKSTLD